MKREWWIVGGVLAAVFLASRNATAAAANADGNDMGTTTNGVTDTVRDLALAIARAEGFGVQGAIPTRANNPGDLVIPGWTGAKLGDQGISVFPSPSEGWSRLYHQLDLIVRERSHVYTLDDTFAEFGAKWTQTQSGEWVGNVLAYLASKGYDVDTETSLREFFA